MRIKSVAVAVIVVLAVPVAAGCGSDEGSSDGGQAAAPAPTATQTTTPAPAAERALTIRMTEFALTPRTPARRRAKSRSPLRTTAMSFTSWYC